MPVIQTVQHKRNITCVEEESVVFNLVINIYIYCGYKVDARPKVEREVEFAQYQQFPDCKV